MEKPNRDDEEEAEEREKIEADVSNCTLSKCVKNEAKKRDRIEHEWEKIQNV